MNNYSLQKILNFIVKDFHTAWNSVAKSESENKCNYMFAVQAMILLEVASRACKNNPASLKNFSDELNKINTKYFLELPGVVTVPTEFDLPYIKNDRKELIHALFDLVRNGHSHHYDTIIAKLTDGLPFTFALTGAVKGRALSAVTKKRSKETDHLSRQKNKKGVQIKVYTDFLFLDIQRAIQRSKISKLEIDYFQRPGKKAGNPYRQGTSNAYSFASKDLKKIF